MDDLSIIFKENKNMLRQLRQNQDGIRSSQIGAMIMLLIDKGVLQGQSNDKKVLQRSLNRPGVPLPDGMAECSACSHCFEKKENIAADGVLHCPFCGNNRVNESEQIQPKESEKDRLIREIKEAVALRLEVNILIQDKERRLDEISKYPGVINDNN